MEYHITFTDGSDAFLAHHGVKGMKWGVRNEETLARYLSGERSKKTKSLIAKNEGYQKKLKRLNDSARFTTRDGHKTYAQDKDAKKANRYFNKMTRISKKIYKSDAKDAGLEPNKKIAKEVGGWWSLKEALNDNEKRAKKAYKNLGKSKVNDVLHPLTPGSEVKKMQKDFESNSPSLKKYKKDLSSGKITKGYYNSMVNREWQREITKPNTKYKFTSSYGPQGGIKRS